jgi:NhaP-type Na+/H+ and K+/H+ antiporter
VIGRWERRRCVRAASSLDGSGFLAVYLAGLARHRADPGEAGGDGLPRRSRLVAQVTMFVVLGLLVFPSQLGDVALEGTVLALVLVFVARPVATFLSTAFCGSRSASSPCSPGPGCAAPSRWCSPPSR